jgi:hypothetical protein
LDQQDADFCASMIGFDCTLDMWLLFFFNPDPTFLFDLIWDPSCDCFRQFPMRGPRPVIGRPREVFTSTLQQCTVLCPDGSPFTYTVQPGRFRWTSQATANRLAFQYACRQARIFKLCLGPLANLFGCKDKEYHSSITIQGRYPPFDVEIISGSLPPGLLDSSSPTKYFLDGVPTATGTFSFTLRATDSRGSTHETPYTIKILDVANSSLANALPDTEYYEQMAIDGPVVGPGLWSIVAGVLPEGLDLNQVTGVISGHVDPDVVVQDYHIRVQFCAPI